MVTYIVTGGTGFLGRHILPRLLERDCSAEVHVLVRSASLGRLESFARALPGGDRVHPLIGDLTEPGLGIDIPPAADHVLHLGAIYDLTVGEEQSSTNVDGTRSVIALAERLGATLHHVSSIAVAGDHRGPFTESDFDLGQGFPTPYHRTKFDAEKLVRDRVDLRWRVYRPAAVVGSSTTGEIDKIDGPYYLFPALAALAKLPEALPVAVPDLGNTNVVPVDYVADAIVQLMHTPALDHRTFHLVSPRAQSMREIYAALAKAAGAPRPGVGLPGTLARPLISPLPIPALDAGRRMILGRLGIPPIILEHLTLPTTFVSDDTQHALHGSGIAVPEFASYAAVLWAYWQDNLDPDRARRPHHGGPLVDRHIVITGASSGIGRASAIAAARKGARVILVARRTELLDALVAQIRADGGKAYGYTCDITDTESVSSTVKTILAEHDHVDMLVNNAGRSIRRGLYHSTDRLHDFERTMAVNYFGAVRMVLALLPQMRARRFGHIVNISSAGVQAHTPRFAAYVASKSALDGFSDVAASETLSDGITFTTIHMPLVKTPMIAPTGQYNAGPVTSPEKAAAMVMRALIERPKRIDVPFGTFGELGAILAPGLKDLMMHQMYRMFPDSPAAKGQSAPQDVAPESAPSRSEHSTSSTARLARRLGRLVPGTHW